MAAFKTAEIEAAVSQFVKANVVEERDELGPVKEDVKFSEVLELISSTLIFDPNSIFYVIFLATNRLSTDVAATLVVVEDIQTAIAEVSHRTKDITRTTLLGDAAAALLEVDTILSSRDALSNSAFNRYLSSTNAFVGVSLEPNIKSGSDLIRPPQKARTDARTALATLATSYADHLAVLAQLQEMLTEFNALNLPVLAIQDSVRKARRDLKSLQATFEDTATTRDAKIAESRDAYLRITAGKAVLNSYNTVSDPSSPRLQSTAALTGRAAIPLGDGVLTKVEVLGTKSAPWEIDTGTNDEFKVAADGALETTYTIVPPTRPSVTTFLDETWDATGPAVAYQVIVTTQDKLEIDGLAPRVVLTAGANRTAANIASDINTWATANSFPYTASSPGGFVKIEKTSGGAQRIRMTAFNGTDRAAILATYTALGFYEGQEDTVAGVTAAELASQINAVGELVAEVELTQFDEGVSGAMFSSTEIDLPLGTLVSLSHVDDILVLLSGQSAGAHRIVSITQPGVDRITVATTQPFVLAESGIEFRIIRELLKITSPATGLTGQIIVGAGNANTTLGFTAAAAKSTTTGFEAVLTAVPQDFTQSDVVEGDLVRITIGVNTTQHVISEITGSNKQLEITPAIDVSLTGLTFQILSAAAVAYENFIAAAVVWDLLREASDFEDDTRELERVMNPLLANKRPSAFQIADANTAATALLSLLNSLSTVLTDFEVNAVGRVDAALKMLQERGMDRGFDTLMDGEIANFFGFDKDDASSSAFMLKSMRNVVVEDLPQSKLDDDGDDIQHDELVVDTDAELDFSDTDSEDEDLHPLGEIPDLDDTDASTLRQRL